MNEAEWLNCTDPTQLLELLQRGRAGERKLRLFACACCQRLKPFLKDERSRRAVAAAEGFAEGLVSETEFEQARWEATEVLSVWQDGTPESYAADAACSTCWPDNWPTEEEAYGAARETALTCLRVASLIAPAGDQERPALAALLRCVFGTRFRRLAANQSWLTSTVVALATGIYDDRAFDRMPILADALQDAGCDNDEVLNHCRDANQVHVRGCWVVDLLLGKT